MDILYNSKQTRTNHDTASDLWLGIHKISYGSGLDLDGWIRIRVAPDTDIQPTISPDTDIRPTISPDTDIRATISPDTDIRPTILPDTDIRATISPDTDIRPTISPDTRSIVNINLFKKYIHISLVFNLTCLHFWSRAISLLFYTY